LLEIIFVKLSNRIMLGKMQNIANLKTLYEDEQITFWYYILCVFFP